MRPNRVKAKLKRGEAAVGAWLHCPSPLAAEAMAHVGFDWLVVDTEHSAIQVETSQMMLQAISTTDTVPLVRVPWNDVVPIKYALDSGAYGVVIPMVSSRDDAVRAVQYCKYPPTGIRGIGGMRRKLYGGEDYLACANDEILVAVQIETAAGLENLDDILQVEGLDVAFVGPADLSAALGLAFPADADHPRFVDALRRVVSACERHGVAPGIFTFSAVEANKRLAEGFRFISLSSDLFLMSRMAAAEWSQVRQPREAAS